MVLAGFHPYIGGAESQARGVAAELRRRGVPVGVLTRRLAGVPHEEVLDAIPVTRLPAWGPGPVAAAVFTLFVFVELLRRRRDYDVIHAHLASAHAVAAAAAGRLLGRRVIVKLAGGKGYGEVATSRGSFLGRLKLKALGALKPILAAPNADILQELSGTPLEGLPTAVVPNGVDLKRFAPPTAEEKAALRRALRWGEGFALLSASRLADDKGVADLLADFFSVWGAAGHGDSRLYIAGTGPQEQALRRRAEDAGARAVFLGPRADMPALCRAADAFLLPSRSEGMSNALLEAMACGLPVLATRVSGISELVENGKEGLLYAPGDFEGLRGTLGGLIRDPGLRERLGKAARAKAAQYGLDNTVDKWLQLYVSGKV